MLSEDAPTTIWTGTAVAAIAGATTGATLAVLRNVPVRQYTISMGLNCAVFGVTFFTLTRLVSYAAQISRPTPTKVSANPSSHISVARTLVLASRTRRQETLMTCLVAQWLAARPVAFCTPSSVSMTAFPLPIRFIPHTRSQTALKSQITYRWSQRRASGLLRVLSSLHGGTNCLHRREPVPPISHPPIPGDDAFAHEQYQPSTTTKGKWKALWDLLEVPEWSPVRRLTDEEYKAILDAKLMELEEEVEWLDRELATGGRIEASGEGEGEKG
ncbi:hypothetical protein BC936DRAFT_148434 [Jimgerdemannia flammicorona]|uniref:Uncharacterized protein n=1 Tax=Jimgerdemannia flammicorona TaxID=994334 RepID=A0A433DKF9_9FUNG|nr:hypothetical protein BC936DRAFT_148434 [Jimgerdemannia flammicorona]